MLVAGAGFGAPISEAIRAAEPWTIRSELAAIALFVLLAVGMWRLLRSDDHQ
ncbi:MAG: hypothetical protein OXF41_17050 [bacterium]|nr:hypothetical protein [bacterium]